MLNTATSSSVTTTTQQKVVTTTAPVNVVARFPHTTAKSRVPVSSNARVTAPRLVAQAEKNSGQSAVPRSSTSHTTAVVTVTRGTTKIITTTATQTFAAKLTETTTSQLMVTVSQGLPASKPRSSASLNVQTNIGPVSPQNQPSTSMTMSSPKHHRPAPSGSAPPNVQHFSGSSKVVFPNVASQNVVVKTSEHTPTMNQQCTVSPSLTQAPIDDGLGNHTGSIQAAQEYSLFNSKTMAQQSMWRAENESQKAINFAAVTGGNNSNSTSNQINIPPPFIEEQPQVDASKAPGYRGTAVCSPVSSKTSSNSTTPPNMPLSSSSYQPFSEQKPLPPIGSNILHNRAVSQPNPNELSSSHFYSNTDLPSRSVHIAHNDGGLYKTNFNEGNAMLNDTQPIMQFHQGNSLQHLNFSQSQQQLNQSSVSMSRLNPKAPDFSSTMHNIPPKPSPIYNGYQVNNQNSSGMYPMGKNVLHNYNRTPVPSNNRWVMPMEQTFNQPNDLITGISGMTLHNLARVAAGTEMLHENGGELVVNNNSPAMSPNLPGPHQMHANDGGHYIEDRKPQPIGTERARKSYNASDWMLNNDAKMMVNNRPWVGSGGNLDRMNLQRSQMYDNFQPMIGAYLVRF